MLCLLCLLCLSCLFYLFCLFRFISSKSFTMNNRKKTMTVLLHPLRFQSSRFLPSFSSFEILLFQGFKLLVLLTCASIFKQACMFGTYRLTRAHLHYFLLYNFSWISNIRWIQLVTLKTPIMPRYMESIDQDTLKKFLTT